VSSADLKKQFQPLLRTDKNRIQQGVIDAGGEGEIERTIGNRDGNVEIVRDPLARRGGIKIQLLGHGIPLNRYAEDPFVGCSPIGFCKLQGYGVVPVRDRNMVGAVVRPGGIIEHIIRGIGNGISWVGINMPSGEIGVGDIIDSIISVVRTASTIDGEHHRGVVWVSESKATLEKPVGLPVIGRRRTVAISVSADSGTMEMDSVQFD